MRRTLQTTVELFAEHPRLEEIKFVVLPLAREILSNINDICVDYKATIVEFGQQLNFDFTLVDEAAYTWQIITMPKEKRESILAGAKDDTWESITASVIEQ